MLYALQSITQYINKRKSILMRFVVQMNQSMPRLLINERRITKSKARVSLAVFFTR